MHWILYLQFLLWPKVSLHKDMDKLQNKIQDKVQNVVRWNQSFLHNKGNKITCETTQHNTRKCKQLSDARKLHQTTTSHFLVKRHININIIPGLIIFSREEMIRFQVSVSAVTRCVTGNRTVPFDGLFTYQNTQHFKGNFLCVSWLSKKWWLRIQHPRWKEMHSGEVCLCSPYVH